VLEDFSPQWFRTSDTNTAASTIGDDASERTLPEPVWSPPPPIRGRIGVSQAQAQASARRLTSVHRGTFRSSTSDFSDFTARRRLTTREGYDGVGEGLTRPESVRSPPPISAIATRRPFYLRRPIRRLDPTTVIPASTSEIVENGSDAGSSTSHMDSSERIRRPRPVSTATWAEGPQEQSSSTHTTSVRYPRLRRGGLRPPEMQPTFLMDPQVGSRSRAEQGGERTTGTEAEDDSWVDSLRLPVTFQGPDPF